MYSYIIRGRSLCLGEQSRETPVRAQSDSDQKCHIHTSQKDEKSPCSPKADESTGLDCSKPKAVSVMTAISSGIYPDILIGNGKISKQNTTRKLGKTQ